LSNNGVLNPSIIQGSVGRPVGSNRFGASF